MTSDVRLPESANETEGSVSAPRSFGAMTVKSGVECPPGGREWTAITRCSRANGRW